MESSSLASAVAGLVGSSSGLILFPLEFLKINIIAGDGYSKNFIPRYRSIKEACVDIHKTGGFLSFYRGCHVSAFSSVAWTLYFYIYDVSKKRHAGIQDSYPTVFKLLTASEAAICSRVLTSPLWVVKTRLILQKNSQSWYGDTLEVVKKIWKIDGFRGFFAGLGPGLCLCTNGILNLFFYELQKELIQCQSPACIGMYGVNSKFLSSIVSYPIQLVMIKLQQEQYSGTILKRSGEVTGSQGEKKFFNGSWECVKTVFEKEGIRGFYRGFSLQVLRTLPGNGLFFILYEETLKWIGNNF